MKIKFFLILFLGWMVITSRLFGQERYLDQKNPIWQSDPEKQADFPNQKLLTLDFIKTITKLIRRDNRVYILDWKMSVVSVFDDRQKLLMTIGRPGQGPGEFEQPRDMDIAPDGALYVLSAMTRRIEVFNPDGKYRDRISISAPKEIFYSNPDMFRLLPNHEILVSYTLSPDFLYFYDSTGKFLRAAAPRILPIAIPGENLGNTSDLLLKKNGEIVLFNRFSGIFTLLSPDGKIRKEFSAYSKIHEKNVGLVLKSQIKAKSSSGLTINEFCLWSNACVDENDNIFVFSQFDVDDHMQNMFVFSPDGEFLYRKTLPFLRNKAVRSIYHYGNVFYFVSDNAGDEEVFCSQQKEPKEK
jgi:hypothetical protein